MPVPVPKSGNYVPMATTPPRRVVARDARACPNTDYTSLAPVSVGPTKPVVEADVHYRDASGGVVGGGGDESRPLHLSGLLQRGKNALGIGSNGVEGLGDAEGSGSLSALMRKRSQGGHVDPQASGGALQDAEKKINSSERPPKDNANDVDFLVYDYMSVQRFTPLSNTNWYAADAVASVAVDEARWTATLDVVFNRLTGAAPARTLPVEIAVTSYRRNCFRVRFSPDGPLETFTHGPIHAAQLHHIRESEQQRGAKKRGQSRSRRGNSANNPASSASSCMLGKDDDDDAACDPNFVTDDPNNALVFETRDLVVYVNTNLAVVVTRKRDGEVVYQDDELWGKSRGLMFVDRRCGTAIASVRRNRKDDAAVSEAFYGAGEVVAEDAGGDYFLERTGLAMTNYNYDNLNYNQPGVVPPEIGDDNPDYYLPMYYAAPWLVVQGYRGKPMQYSYGWFLDNAGQTYMNTGDAAFNGAADKAYVGAACGPFDQHFVYGAGDGIEPVVTAFALLQGRDYQRQKLNRRAVMPPKYVFGFFQGVYGARGLLDTNVKCTTANNYTTFEKVVDGYQGNNVPLEGLAVDIDVQDDLKVFTTRDAFWTAGKVGRPDHKTNKSVFAWAHSKGLVTQTNITCFVRADVRWYSVYDEMVKAKAYTKNDADDAKNPKWAGTGGPPPFATNTVGPSDAYCGKLNYGGGDECRAIFPDWGRPGTAEWWGKNYATLFKLGLDFVWQDMTVPAMAPHVRGKDIMEEPDYAYLDNVPRDGTFNWKSYHPQTLVHDLRKDNGDREPFFSQRNMHAYRLCEATREQGLLAQQGALTKFKRSFIIARGGYIGNQHFGGIWVGDNSSTQDFLQMMITSVLNMNMSCMPVVGADIGGFTSWKDREPCPERLMNRWVQAGCLLPWFRDHYDRWVDDKKHGKDFQELYCYPGSLASMRAAIELRYRWQDVLYTAMYHNVMTGAPLVKAMSMWNYDPNVIYHQRDQFMLGGHDGYQILCAPIVHVDSDVRDVYLPAGAVWMQYGMHGDAKTLGPRFDGGQTIFNFWVAHDELILFVREGAILPARYTKEEGVNKSLNTYGSEDPVVFEVFGLVDGCQGQLYVDDGGVTTQAEDDGVFTVVNVTGALGTVAAAESSTTRQEGQDSAMDAQEKSKAEPAKDGRVGTLSFEAEEDAFDVGDETMWYVRVRNCGEVESVDVDVGACEATTACQRADVDGRYGLFATDGAYWYWVDEHTQSVWVKVPTQVLVAGADVTISCSNAVYAR